MGLLRDRPGSRAAIGLIRLTATPVRGVAGVGARASGMAWRGAVRRLGASTLVRDALDEALAGPLADELAERLAAHRVLERVTARLLEGETLERLLVLADERRVGIRAGDALLERQGAERVVAYLL
jgi:hypothetical protein